LIALVLKRKVTDQEIIDGVLENDTNTIKLIYKNNFNRIKSMVRGFRKINLEPEDVFQEGLTRAIINVRNKKFNGNSSFSTYLYGICRNLCLKDYNSRKQVINVEIKNSAEPTNDDHFEVLQLVNNLKDLLDDQCKRIINLRFGIGSEEEKTVRFDEIAKVMDINEDNARQKFHRCFAKLKSLILNHHELKQLIG